MDTSYNVSRYISRACLFAALLFGITTSSYAQIGNASSILQASQEDANKLMEAYLKPFGSGFGAALNTGWTNTAKPHKKFGFDVTFGLSTALVPSGDETFDISALDLSSVQVESGGSVTSTVSGPDTDTRIGIYADNPSNQGPDEFQVAEFGLPGGADQPYVPSPVIKAGVGLPFDTEVMVRFMPTTTIPVVDADIGVWGFGLKHNILQWIPVASKIPVDVSVMGAYSSLSLTKDFDVTPDNVINQPDNTTNPYASTPSTWDGQKVELSTNAYNLNLLVGKTLPIVSFYGGIGIESSTTTIGTPGAYPVVKPNSNYDPQDSESNQFIVDQVDGPIDIELEGENNFRAIIGTRVRITVLTITASYTQSAYPSAMVGLGVSFR